MRRNTSHAAGYARFGEILNGVAERRRQRDRRHHSLFLATEVAVYARNSNGKLDLAAREAELRQAIHLMTQAQLADRGKNGTSEKFPAFFFSISRCW